MSANEPDKSKKAPVTREYEDCTQLSCAVEKLRSLSIAGRAILMAPVRAAVMIALNVSERRNANSWKAEVINAGFPLLDAMTSLFDVVIGLLSASPMQSRQGSGGIVVGH